MTGPEPSAGGDAPILRVRTSGGSPFRLHARLVVGADGLRSLVARRLGLVRREPKPRKLSLTAHVRGVLPMIEQDAAPAASGNPRSGGQDAPGILTRGEMQADDPRKPGGRMRTVDERVMRAPAGVCFDVAADVEQWPRILPHYRRVRFHQSSAPGTGRVEMAAWRDFAAGPARLRWPTWWLSDMRAEPARRAIYYRHLAGITRGMDVKWEMLPRGEQTLVRIIHEWSGPRWPLIGHLVANAVIGPGFISAIAQRTLAGIAAEAERRAGTNRPTTAGGR